MCNAEIVSLAMGKKTYPPHLIIHEAGDPYSPAREHDRLMAVIKGLRSEIELRERGRVALVDALKSARTALANGQESHAEMVICEALAQAGVAY